MVWTKEELDKYVRQVSKSCADPRERNMKRLTFATLYREVSDLENAKRYVEAYISESEGDYRGHRLMGQLHEEEGQWERAVTSYRRSLELNNTQKELVLKVVKLYCKVPVHPDRARAWADRGARLFPGHPDVFNLKLHLLESANIVDYEALEDLISEELGNRPREVGLHVRLVRLYAVRGRINEAFSHCVAVLKTKAFKESLEWYACCVEIFEKFVLSLEKLLVDGQVIGSGHAVLEAHSFLLTALCHFLELHLQHCSTREVINVLYRLDHCLYMACGRKIRHSPRRVTSEQTTEWEVVLAEMKAQLYMHCGTLLIRLAKEKFLSWPRSLKMACACYWASLGIPEPETKMPWVARAPKNKDPFKWYIMACSRLSHVGHFLMAVNARHGTNWLNACYLDCFSRQGWEDILRTVYRGEKDLTKSFLGNDGEFYITDSSLPVVSQLVAWDEVSLREDPRNLQSITWVGLHWYQYDQEMRPGVGVMVKDIFPELRMDVPNTEKHIAPNMLCLRDLEAFVYAVVRTAGARILEDKDIHYEDFEPRILPRPLCSSLSLPVQDEWWLAAYNFYAGKYNLSESGKIRRTVQLGIEQIRAIDLHHGLQIQLLIYLAKAFETKASLLRNSGPNPWYYEEHWKSLERWSVNYWQKALVILEMLEKDESIPHCDRPLFPQLFNTLQESEVTSYLQSARTALGGAAMNEGRLEEAMELFEQVKTPPGVYNLAQIYKYLAQVEARAATEDTDPECAGPAQEYYQNLIKARELLLFYLKMTDSFDVERRRAVMDELNEIEAMIKSGVTQEHLPAGHHFRQLSDPESRSSYVSDVQESEDNFWEEKPQDSSTKDLIAKLSEVTLNNGYLQEQMAIRDETMASMSDQISSLQEQLSKLQKAYLGYSGGIAATLSDQSSREENKPIFESTPVAAKQASVIKGPRTNLLSSVKGPLKLDASFFSGLSSSNSPEARAKEKHEDILSPVSPRRERLDSSTSYGEEIHFEPLIPLPEKIEIFTGEENEEVMFSSRAKLYRFDKNVSAWKERGLGTIKILHNSYKRRFRILMRRDVVHKICANHFITVDMKLEGKKGTANSWIWNTFADLSDCVSQPEQLAVKFKTQEDAWQFKEIFEKCQNTLKSESPVSLENGSRNGQGDAGFMDKFAPKPGTWSCSVCLISNEELTSVCAACGAVNLSEEVMASSLPVVPKSGFSLSNQPLPLFSFGTPPSISTLVYPGPPATASSNVQLSFGTVDREKQKQSTEVTTSTFTFLDPGSSVSESTVLSTGVLPTSVTPSTQQVAFPSFKLATSTTGVSSTSFPFSSSNLNSASHFSLLPQTSSTIAAQPAPTQKSPSVFGGSVEKSTPMSFGVLGSGKSPVFSLDSSDVSTSGTQTEPFICEKCEGEKLVAQDATPKPSPPSSFSSSLLFQPGISEQKSFWDKPTGTFQFGHLEEIPPLGGAAHWTAYSNFWRPGTTAASAASPSLGSQQITVTSSQSPSAASFSQGGVSFGVPQPQQQVSPNTNPSFDFPSSTLLRQLVLGQTQANVINQAAPEPKGYDFTPYVVDEPTPTSKRTSLPKDTKPVSTVIVEEYDSDSYENQITDTGNSDESEGSSEETSSYSSGETEDNLGEIEEEIESTMQKAPTHDVQRTLFAVQNQPAVIPPTRPVTFHSSEVGKSGPVPLPSQIAGRRFLTARSPLRSAKKQQDEDCVIVYEIRPSRSEREKAANLMLPINFFNYTKGDVFPGCRGIVKAAPDEAKPKVKAQEEKGSSNSILTFAGVPKAATGADHVFGQFSDFSQLSFSSVRPQDGTSFSQKTSNSTPFYGAGAQLFSEDSGDRDADNLHFEPVIPLPDEVQVVTGEEGLDVLFNGRAKLYRFDKETSQWKERGIGDIKLLRHPSSGQGRVLMRREQIKKVCANHNITPGMELKPNVGSDRSWVWYTPADYAEDESKPEQLAIKFKTPETAAKFKEVFEKLRDSASAGVSPKKDEVPDQAEEKCVLYKHFVSAFVRSPGSWACEMCYVQNKAVNATCEACGSPNPTSKSQSKVEETASTVDIKPKTLEGIEPDSSYVGAVSEGTTFSALFKSAPLFTIGRGDGESCEDKTEDEVLSPSKISSPSTQQMPKEKSVTPALSAITETGFPFGSNTPAKFTFNLQVSPGSPLRKPKSPPSPASPLSPESPVRGEEDGPYFEPLIPLPEKIERLTGEEDENVLFCDRCKLFRYDNDTSQWKERGVGDLKILYHAKSGKHRVLMRREHVFKLCANHSLSNEMQLKPFPNSEKAWLWNTLADFSGEEPNAETLAARFRTKEIATEFKKVFDKVIQTYPTSTESSKAEASSKTLHQASGETSEDVLVTFEQDTSQEQKEKAVRLHLPENFFAYESQSLEASQNESPKVKSDVDQTAASVASQPSQTPSKATFLFGSPSVAALSFQSVAKSSLGSSPFNLKSSEKSPGFAGAGSRLFASQSPGEEDGDTDEPHFEPVIPLPDKIEIKTGEEDEEVLFSHRAKLYRFVAENKQWKERGVGDIKLLRNKESGRMRVLMRRDQIKKLCANHQITVDMKLQPNTGSDRSWVWSTMADFSEEESRAEQLAVRFKTEEMAKAFKEKFDECLVMLEQQKPIASKEKAKEYENYPVVGFKPHMGSWERDTCMIQNDSSKMQGAACGTNKLGAEPSQAEDPNGKTAFFGGAVSSSTSSREADRNGEKPTSKTATTPASSSSQTLESATKEDETDDLFAKFQPKTGSWECGMCMIRNDSDKTQCVACETPKPGAKPTGADHASRKTVFVVGARSIPSDPTFTFGIPTNSDKKEQEPIFSFGVSSQAPSTTSESKFTFGFPQRVAVGGGDRTIQVDEVSSSVDQAPECISSEHDAEKSSVGLQLGEKPVSIQDTTPSKEEVASHHESDKDQEDNAKGSGNSPKVSGFLFGSESVSSLSFQSVAASLDSTPFSKKTPEKQTAFYGAGSKLFSSQSPGEVIGATCDDTDGPHFEPVIPLPDKIEVKTGEEDEEVLFSHRAKLYRFVAENKQWKERGVGDIKLLRNKESGRMRVLMRRDQIKKLCANHQITVDMKLQPNTGSDRSWVWSTMADFSEEESRAEQLAVRFKTEEMAKAFKEKFDECLVMLEQQKPKASKEKGAGTSELEDTDGKTVGSLSTGSEEVDSNGRKPAATTSSTAASSSSQNQDNKINTNETDDLLAQFKPETGSWDTTDRDTVPGDALQEDTAQENPTQKGTIQEDTVPGDALREDTAQENPTQEGTNQEDTVTGDALQEDTAQEKPTQERTIKEDTVAGDALQEDTAQENPTQERTIQEDTVPGDTLQDGTAQENPAQEDTAQGNPAQENPAQGNPAQENPAQEGTNQEDTVPGDALQEGTAQENPAQENPAQEGTNQEDTVPGDALQEDTAQENPSQEGAIQEDTVQGDALQEDTVPGEAIQEDTAQENSTQEGTNQEGTLPGDALQGDIQQRDTAQKNTMPEDTTHTDISQESIIQVDTLQGDTAKETTTDENSIQGDTTHRDTVPGDALQEDTAQENPTQEGTNQEDTVPGDALQEDTAQEIATQEGTNQEDTVLGDAIQEETAQENSTQEGTNQEDTLPGDALQGDIQQRDTAQKNTMPEDTTHTDTSQESIIQVDTLQGDTAKETTTDENSIQGDTTHRDTVPGDALQEDTAQENPTQEGTNQEDTVPGDALQEDTAQEIATQEGTNQEDTVLGDALQEDTAQENPSQEGAIQEDTVQGDALQEDTVPGDAIQEDTAQENSTQEGTNQEDTLPGDALQGDIQQRDTAQKNTMPEDTTHTDISQESIIQVDTLQGDTAKETTTDENSIQGDTTHRDTVPGDALQEDTAQENPTQEGTNQEDTVPGDALQEDTAQEIATQEGTNQEDTVLGDAIQEDTAQENSTQEGTNQEDTLPGDTLQGDIQQRDTAQKNTMPEDTTHTDISQESIIQVDTLQGDTAKETTTDENSIQGDTTHRDTVPGDALQEDTAQENPTQEGTNQEDTVPGDALQEDTAQEIATQEGTNQEDTVLGDALQEDTAQENPSQEGTIQGDALQEDALQEDTAQENPTQEGTIQGDALQEDALQGDTLQEDALQEDALQEDTAQENPTQEGTNQENTVPGDALQEDTAQENPTQEGTIQEDTVEGEALQEDTAQENPTQEGTDQDDTVPGDALQEDTAQENPTQEGTNQEDTVPGDALQEDTAQENPTQENTIQEETTHGDKVPGDTLQWDIPERDTAQKNTMPQITTHRDTSQEGIFQGDTPQGETTQEKTREEDTIQGDTTDRVE